MSRRWRAEYSARATTSRTWARRATSALWRAGRRAPAPPVESHARARAEREERGALVASRRTRVRARRRSASPQRRAGRPHQHQRQAHHHHRAIRRSPDHLQEPTTPRPRTRAQHVERRCREVLGGRVGSARARSRRDANTVASAPRRSSGQDAREQQERRHLFSTRRADTTATATTTTTSSTASDKR